MTRWEDIDPSFLAISWPDYEGAPVFAGKSCMSVPCPSFETATLDVIAVCSCRDLAPGQMYAPGCGVHDPAVVGA